jgi:putative endonuclease
MKKTQKQKSYYFGIFAEYIAIIFLTLKGYKILHRRYKTYVGEIDLIAKKAGYLIAIEVKARKNLVLIEEVLSEKQKHRIKKAMMVFLSSAKNYSENYGVRFDLVIVKRYRIPLHLKGFWE